MENSGSNQVVKKKNVEVSCWNCFNVEKEDKDDNQEDNEIEVPLSKIREENRGKFRLYSVLAAEVMMPKTVPLKQKVRENYIVGKKIEKKLVNEANNKKNVCIQVNEDNVKAIEAANVDLPSSSDDEEDSKKVNSESTQTESKGNILPSLQTSNISVDEQDDSNEIKKESNVSSESSDISSKTKCSPITKHRNLTLESPKNTLSKPVKADSENLIKNTQVDGKSNVSLENLNISSKTKGSPITKHRNLSFESPKNTLSKQVKADLENIISVNNTQVDGGSNVSLESLNISSKTKCSPITKHHNLSFESPKNTLSKSVKEDSKNLVSIKNTQVDGGSNVSLECSNISPKTKYSPITKHRNLSFETPKNTLSKQVKVDSENLISVENIQVDGGSNVSFESSNISSKTKGSPITKHRNLSFESPKNTLSKLVKADSENIISVNNTQVDGGSNVSLECSNISSKTTPSSLSKQLSKVSLKITLPTPKKDSENLISNRNNQINKELNMSAQCSKPPSKTKFTPIIKNRNVYQNVSHEFQKKTLSRQENVDLENSQCESTISEDNTSVPLECLDIPLPDDEQEDLQTSSIIQTDKEQSMYFDSPNAQDQTEIKYKVQIETSTPKTNIEIQDIKAREHPRTTNILEEQESNKYDIRKIIESVPNMTIPERDESVAESEKTDVTSSNNSESGYEGSSIRDLNDIDSLKKSASNKSLVSTSFNQGQNSRDDFKSSLPVLNLIQRKNILKSTKSLSGDSIDSEHKPVKSLRWSTLTMPHRSSRLNDEVYMSDSVSPNHATLPRRSNSPHHERDMLDRDRFSLNRSGLQVRSESMASVYSGAGEGTRANVTIRGEVQISLLYNYRLGALEVGVKRCRDLAPVDVKRNRSDPYVKVYLLPDKSKAGKRKTKVKKNTLSPVFEESLSFVQPLASLSARTLWLSVWHADMFGRNDFLGEVTLPLADVVFDDPAPMWYKLHERTEQFDEHQGSRGDLIIGLKLELSEGARGKGTLHVLVKEAKNLVATKPNGLADVFCKSYLLPERGRLAKQKTGVSRRTLAPRWEHTFTYRGLSLNELGARALELSLWDRDRLASNDFMGGVRLSLGTGTYMGANVNWMDSVGKEVTLWQTMMQRPNFWVEGSLPLRPNLSN